MRTFFGSSVSEYGLMMGCCEDVNAPSGPMKLWKRMRSPCSLCVCVLGSSPCQLLNARTNL
jgi:hypothetical protein